MRLKKGDLFIALILIVAVLGWFAKDFIFTDNANKNAIIKIDGQVYTTLKLDSNSEQEEIFIDLPDEQFMRVIMENGEIWAVESTCPDDVCVKTGKISKPGESIVCLPNKIVIFIEGTSEEGIDDLSS